MSAGAPQDPLLLMRGHTAADFAAGRVFEHAQRKTLSASDHALFTALTMHYNPVYLDVTRAQALGYRDMPVNPLLVFNLVFGISVEDLSEGGGPFLGVDDLSYDTPAYVGDTVRAQSTVVSRRDSSKYDQYAIVSWATEGYNQKNERLVRFQRTNLVRRSR
jgi:itaconyl-CoA hydratase